jgi:hypothetical protein
VKCLCDGVSGWYINERWEWIECPCGRAGRIAAALQKAWRAPK